MASLDRSNTIFPGSDGRKPLRPFSKESTALSDDDETQVPAIPRISSTRTYTKSSSGRILPVKPVTSYDSEPVVVLEGSPWDLYQKAYRLELGGSVAVVHKKPATADLFIIRSFSGPSADKKLSILRQLQHENLLTSHQIFSFKNVFYVVSEFMAISLEEVTIARPTEPQLATIIHQILNGISFFVSQNLTHGAINCSNILLSSKGDVKIANPECCGRSTQLSNSEDIRALGRVMQQLMEKGTEDGALGLERPDLWSEDAVDFLSMTLSASSQQLAEHEFLKDPLRKEDLVWFVSLAQVSACRFYKYEKS